jgi:replicative DNA helicase
MESFDVQLVNTEAEQAVLGSILCEGELIKELSLNPDHFSKRHQFLFKAMREVDEAGDQVDIVTVTTKLGEAVQQFGGVAYLSQLADSVPSTASIHSYERFVLEAYRLREMQRLATDFASSPSEEKINELYTSIGNLQEIGIVKQRSKNDILFEILEDINEDKGEMIGIDTGLKDLNKMTGGLQGGDLIIVAARPSMGKTAFALNLGMSNCIRNGATDIFSLEMPDKQLTQRMLSSLGNINGAKWRNPYKYFRDSDHEKLSTAVGIYEKWDMHIHDQPKQTVADIRAAVRRTNKDLLGKKHLVIIDYLQLITPIGRFERHDLAVGSITSELKQMARTFNIPVVLLSQLSRGVEQRQDKRPMMSDLKDSSAIEQDADLIMFLYRDDYYNKESEQKNIVEIDISKQRNGPVGKVDLAFMKEYGSFANLERKDYENRRFA